MTYTFPTNKLRDLVAVLQTLDPDIDHRIGEVKVRTDELAKKRVLHIDARADVEAKMIAEITDQINPRCDAKTIEDLVVFINALDEQNDELKETIKRIREALDD